MKTVCCSDCERKFECAKHAINNNGVHFSEDYYNYGSYAYSDNGFEIKYWCGNLGNYKMFEQIIHKWNELYDKIPLIYANELMKMIESSVCTSDDGSVSLDEIRCFIDKIPAIDVVSRGLFEQYKWERNIAIGQLEELGICFGQKIDGVYLTKEEHEKLLEYKYMYENLCK